MHEAVLLTRHHKAKWISPALSSANFNVTEYTQFNTDELGTFCGLVNRPSDAKTTAKKKAELACSLTGSRYGLGSEGSFTQQAFVGFTWEQEILCLYDAKTNFAIFGISEGPAGVVAVNVKSLQNLHESVSATPAQKWMIQDVAGNWHKGLSADELEHTINHNRLSFPLDVVPDYRAMNCPSRQQMIEKAAQDLCNRLTSLCPKCGATNFIHEHKKVGLPCELCTLPTKLPKGWLARCVECGHEDFIQSEEKHASAQYCDFCNP